MKRTRDAGAIGDTGTFQKAKAKELVDAISKLNKDILDLRNSYTGAGASANIIAFLNGVKNFENVAEKINKYGSYQEGIFTHDSTNIETANQEVTTLLNQALTANKIDPTLATAFSESNTIDAGNINLESEGDINA